ncbi:hypothetical protein E2562_025269 [Oryza meyeriana var. granulata]|uniref:Uncharacterized protein n=1 Tax=Oryza meyeriana var. granulata TaxID=110450 RepID=A0A6G1C020_9ORYZ|nr:hypothetical protein E2562_025269 [Oryza meyeriana var. granulata]
MAFTVTMLSLATSDELRHTLAAVCWGVGYLERAHVGHSPLFAWSQANDPEDVSVPRSESKAGSSRALPRSTAPADTIDRGLPSSTSSPGHLRATVLLLLLIGPPKSGSDSSSSCSGQPDPPAGRLGSPAGACVGKTMVGAHVGGSGRMH